MKGRLNKYFLQYISREDRERAGGQMKPHYRGRDNDVSVGEELDPEHKLLRFNNLSRKKQIRFFFCHTYLRIQQIEGNILK